MKLLLISYHCYQGTLFFIRNKGLQRTVHKSNELEGTSQSPDPKHMNGVKMKKKAKHGKRTRQVNLNNYLISRTSRS